MILDVVQAPLEARRLGSHVSRPGWAVILWQLCLEMTSSVIEEKSQVPRFKRRLMAVGCKVDWDFIVAQDWSPVSLFGCCLSPQIQKNFFRSNMKFILSFDTLSLKWGCDCSISYLTLWPFSRVGFFPSSLSDMNKKSL